MAAETQYTANTGLVQIATANTSLTGGTIGTNIFTVITGASNGTLIKTVSVKAPGSPSQGMIRLFVYDGTNQRLLTEIEVDPIIQSGPDISFEKTVNLDFTLASGDSLLVSAQNGDTFNIIAEGLNISYYSSYVRPESTNYIANTGAVAISTGNSSTTGGGTSKLITATSGLNGTVIESINIKATGATSADGMIRIYISPDNGTTFYLFTEVFVPYSSQNGTYQSFEHKIVFPKKFQLKASYSLWVSTQNSDSFHIVAEGMDWNYPSGPTANYTSVSLGPSNTTETLLRSYQIPAGLFRTGNLIGVYANATFTTNHTKTLRIYINTSNSLTGATCIAQYVSFTEVGDNMERMFPIISDTAVECFGNNTNPVHPNSRNQYSTTNIASSNVTVPSISAGFWLLISGQNASGLDTTTLMWSMVEKIF